MSFPIDSTTETYNPPSNDWMQTFTGKAFYPLNVGNNDVDIYDIAHSLGMQCRYNGHTRVFYSVAEHCVLMSYVVPAEDALWALLHDAPEAYIGDMVRPLKKHMNLFREVDERIMEIVCDAFDLPLEMPESVKVADNRIIENERLALLGAPPYPWTVHGEAIPDIAIQGWNPAEAEFRYFNRFQELMALRGDQSA